MMSHTMSRKLIRCAMITASLCLPCVATAQTLSGHSKGPGKIVVHPKFGGQIYGFDIDQNGTEGILADVQSLPNGKNVLSAVETFDQRTGKILKVVSKTETQDNDIVLGVVANSTAIIEHEHVGSNGFVDQRPYRVISPLNSNKYTGLWKPPHFNKNDIVIGVSVNQITSTTAILDLDNIYPGAKNLVFGSDVSKNTFGPMVKLSEPDLEPYNFPLIAIDTKTSTAVVAQSQSCTFGCAPEVALVDLVRGKAVYFTGVGAGLVGGIGVDAEDGIAVTTTSEDSNVEFYDLKTHVGFTELLPAGQGRIRSGTDVEFDPIHKLFLVGQPFGPNNDSFIQVYDPKGNLKESLNFGGGGNTGLSFSYIALQPKQRSGFVNTPKGLRSFTY